MVIKTRRKRELVERNDRVITLKKTFSSYFVEKKNRYLARQSGFFLYENFR